MSNLTYIRKVARNPINFVLGSPAVTMAHKHDRLALFLSIDLHLSLHVTYMHTHVLYVLLMLLHIHVYTSIPGCSWSIVTESGGQLIATQKPIKRQGWW